MTETDKQDLLKQFTHPVDIDETDTESLTETLTGVEPCEISQDYCELVAFQKEKAIKIIQNKTENKLNEIISFSVNMTVRDRNLILDNYKKSGFDSLNAYALFILKTAKINVTL